VPTEGERASFARSRILTLAPVVQRIRVGDTNGAPIGDAAAEALIWSRTSTIIISVVPVRERARHRQAAVQVQAVQVRSARVRPEASRATATESNAPAPAPHAMTFAGP
jgi:hypothetical protein